jgi:pimeloyl-ACP methyl ester carboxylesterase
VNETDVPLGDGRVLHVYDTGPADGAPVLWHHGTPNIGTPPAPLFPAGSRLGLRWVAYDRPGYGGSSPEPGRTVASAAAWAFATADALGLSRFALAAHSGGGPHALATAALLPDRVTSVLAISSLAPYDADRLDFFAGMGPAGQGSLRAALAGRVAKEEHEAGADAIDFTDADWAALQGEWGWFGSVVEPAVANGLGPLIDDDLAYVAPWGFDPAAIGVPVHLLHGEDDLIAPVGHARWLAARIPGASLTVVPGAGHVSVLESAGDALGRAFG